MWTPLGVSDVSNDIRCVYVGATIWMDNNGIKKGGKERERKNEKGEQSIIDQKRPPLCLLLAVPKRVGKQIRHTRTNKEREGKPTNTKEGGKTRKR